MDSGLEYLLDLAENDLQKAIMEIILEKGVNDESIEELIKIIEGGSE